MVDDTEGLRTKGIFTVGTSETTMATHDEGVPIVCEKCGYDWSYSGDLYQTTCPRCNNKTKTPHHEDYSEDSESVEQLKERREDLLSKLVEVQQQIDEHER